LKSSKYNSFIVCSLVRYAELACCASPSAGELIPLLRRFANPPV
jgi:hypothetical protein